jgi:SAM-dependent methyltransferase
VWRALKSVAQTGDPAEIRQFLKGWAKFPVEYAAARAMAKLPLLKVDDIAGDSATEISLRRLLADTGEWSLNLTERLVLSIAVKGRRANRIFEIGTFDGGTTKLLAELIPEDGIVVTLDLPEAAFDATQHPHAFKGADVGRAFRDTSVERRIKQLRDDSLHFDPSPLERSFDVVLVDGGHDYAHGFADSRTALRLVRPGGIVLWDDFEAYWAGLVSGIIHAMKGHHLARLHGAALAVHLAPS